MGSRLGLLWPASSVSVQAAARNARPANAVHLPRPIPARKQARRAARGQARLPFSTRRFSPPRQPRQEHASRESIGERGGGAARLLPVPRGRKRPHPQGLAFLGEASVRKPSVVLADQRQRARKVPTRVSRLGALKQPELGRIGFLRGHRMPGSPRLRDGSGSGATVGSGRPSARARPSVSRGASGRKWAPVGARVRPTEPWARDGSIVDRRGRRLHPPRRQGARATPPPRATAATRAWGSLARGRLPRRPRRSPAHGRARGRGPRRARAG